MRKLIGVIAVVVLAALLPSRPAGAAGVTTHAWMALEAVDLVETPQLKALLQANIAQVEGGAQFPDSGYWNAQFGVPGGDYGEEAHWQRFFDAYAANIRNDATCGDLTAPDGPCAPRIAHLMGAMAHGMGDEVWDWLFEPNAPDRGESYIPPELASLFGVGGIELQMDIIAIHEHGRPTSPDTPGWPALGKLAASFAAVGRPDITESGLAAGKSGMTIIRNGEASLAEQFYDEILANMPWTSANMVTAPGGVQFAARAIAAEYENMWGQLLGDQPRTEVSVTYPADGEKDIPSTGWQRDSFLPGSSPGRGGARNRIAAALSYSLPYVAQAGDPTNLPSLLPAGAMTLTDTSTGTLVPVKSGYPKAVPYAPNAGEHLIDIQPALDLTPCTGYRVDVTDALIDAKGRSVVPTSWTFRTDGCVRAAPGTASVVEGDTGTTVLQVPVTLSKASGRTVTARWETVFAAGAPAGQADPSTDYTPVDGTVTFAPGETSQTVSIPVSGDTTREPDEYIVVSFHAPVGADLGGFLGLGFGKILDDDPVPTVVPGAAVIAEGASGTAPLRVPVTLSNPSSRPVTVQWVTRFVPGAPPGQADPSTDYAPATGTATFAPGETSKTVTIDVNGDTQIETDEYFVVLFGKPVDATMGGFWGLGFGSILDDDP